VLHRRATRCEVVCVASSCNEEHQVATLRDAPRQFCKGRQNTENLPQTHDIVVQNMLGAEYAGLHCELQRFRGAKLQHGATCCTTYIEAATAGLSRAMETPSQTVVTAAVAVAHTASMKSKQSRAQPAVGISFCPARAGTRACVVKLCAASLAACANVRANGRLPCPTRHGIQWRVPPACADGGRLAALSSPTVVSVSGWDDNETAAR
jgi:hypothetical protein